MDIEEQDGVEWAKQRRFHLKREAESSLRNVVSNLIMNDG
jgi:hypothetical protein